MGHDISRSLLTRIKRYIARNGLTPTEFGKRAVNDPSLVIDLERGRSPTLKTVERIEAFMKGVHA